MSGLAGRSKDSGRAAAGGRVRVRTPGKHIVLFGLAVTFMLGLSTTALRSGKVSIPDYHFSVEAGEKGPLYAPPLDYLTDLAPDASGRSAFLKARLKIVARDREALSVLIKREPFIQERVGFFLRGLTPEDFEGSAGMERVKSEILKRVNIAAAPDAASEVVFEDLVIQ